MEITKREVLFSIVMVSFMVLIGMVIGGNISDHLMNKYQKYNTALRIENDQDMFVYGAETNVGDTLSYGELKAVDTVSYDGVNGEYSYIKKVKERYTMHTRIVGSGKTRHTEIYYTWDEVDSEKKHSKELTFLGVKFKYENVELPSSNHIVTLDGEHSDIRYVYYGKKTSYTGTLFAYLENGTINNAEFYDKSTIEQVLSDTKSNILLIMFWVLWIGLTCIIVFGFYYLENNWLED